MGCQPCRPTVTDGDIDKVLVVRRNTNPFEKTVDRFSSTNPFGSETGESFPFSFFYFVMFWNVSCYHCSLFLFAK